MKVRRRLRFGLNPRFFPHPSIVALAIIHSAGLTPPRDQDNRSARHAAVPAQPEESQQQGRRATRGQHFSVPAAKTLVNPGNTGVA
jgi:hypothetical protein